MFKSAGSFYVKKEDLGVSRKLKRNSFKGLKAFSFLALALVFIISSLIPVVVAKVSNGKVSAGSFGVFCSDHLGYNMKNEHNKVGWAQNIPYVAPERGNRKYNIQEALGRGMAFVSYEGEGEGTNLVAERSDKETYKSISKTDPKILEDRRTVTNCTVGFLGNAISNGILGLANGITGITQFIVVSAFDSELICTDVDNPNGNCFNLLKVIGGDSSSSSNGGLIGILTTSLYFPLIFLVIFASVGYLIFLIIKGRFREGLWATVWIVGSFVIGLALLLKPAMLTKAPAVVSSNVAACVMGAFNGENCFSGKTIDKVDFKSSSEAACESYVTSGSRADGVKGVANNLSCSIWKSFVLNMYAEASFGTSFNNLDTLDTSRPTNKILKDKGLNPEDYCVPLKSIESVNSSKNGRLKLYHTSNENRVCNLAAYQMFLQINAEGAVDKIPSGNVDTRWYKIIDAAAANPAFWDNWTSSGWGSKLGLSFMSVLASILGGAVLVSTAMFSMVYYVTGVILMVFAPVFFLLGIHPQKGKRLLLGWLEQIFSNVAKYIASAVFLVATVAIYGGVLGDVDNVAYTLIFLILITMALWMYRKEIVELFGRVSMGGQQLSNNFMNKISSSLQHAGTFAAKTAAAGVGAKLVGGSVTSGIADSVMRQAKRSGGTIGAFAQAVDRENIANRAKVREKASEARKERIEKDKELQSLSAAQDNDTLLLEQQRSDYERIAGRLDVVRDNRLASQAEAYSISEEMKANALRNIEEINKDSSLSDDEKAEAITKQEHIVKFANMQSLATQQAAIVQSMSGEMPDEERTDLVGKFNDLEARKNALRSGIEMSSVLPEFEAKMRDRNAEVMLGDELREVMNLENVLSRIDKNMDTVEANMEKRQAKIESVSKARKDAEIREDIYEGATDKFEGRPGAIITGRKVNKTENVVAKARVEAKVVSDETAERDRRAEVRRNKGRGDNRTGYGAASTGLDGTFKDGNIGNVPEFKPRPKRDIRVPVVVGGPKSNAPLPPNEKAKGNVTGIPKQPANVKGNISPMPTRKSVRRNEERK